MERPGGAPPDHRGPAPGPKRVEALGARVGSGASWMMVAVLIAKLGSLASNVVLGWMLAQKEFGVFAAAMGIASVVGVFRSAGIRQVVVQKGARRYDKLEGPSFWYGTTLCAGAGGLLAALAYPLEWFYGKEVAELLIVLGIGLAISALPAVYHSKLAVDLRYRRMAELQVASAIARFGSMIALALLGFGAMSLALPWVIASLTESTVGFLMTRRTPWSGPARVRLWPAFMSRVTLIILGNAGIALMRQGTYIVLGALETSRVLGVYFFAYQLLDQINILLGMSLQQVLLPALSMLAGQPKRHAAAILRAARVMLTAGVLFALGLGCVIGPLEELIWRFKWVDSVPAVQVMTVFFPVRLLVGVYNASMMSRGQYRPWSRTLIVQGLGMMVAVGVAGWFSDEPWVLALAAGLYFSFVVLPAMTLGLRRIGVSPLDLMGVLLPGWAIGLTAMNASLWLDVEVIAPELLRTRLLPPGETDWAALGAAGLRMASLGLTFFAVNALLLRTLRRQDLEELLKASPGRLRRHLRRLAMLPASAGEPAPAPAPRIGSDV